MAFISGVGAHRYPVTCIFGPGAKIMSGGMMANSEKNAFTLSASRHCRSGEISKPRTPPMHNVSSSGLLDVRIPTTGRKS